MQRQLCSFEKLEIVAFYIYLKSSQCEIQTADQGKCRLYIAEKGKKYWDVDEHILTIT